MPPAMRKPNVALVTGALGITGRNLVRHLATLPDWEIVAVSRRQPDFDARATFVTLDLLDAAAARAQLGGLGITQVFACAYAQGADEFAAVDQNLRLLQNTVEAAVSPALRRVVLVEGPKWYGAHLGPYRTPAKEDDPRHLPPNFYYDQQDYLSTRAARGDFSWTALRPSGICGFAVGNPMNLSTALAVYAVICKELGLTLRFPGRAATYHAICEMTDADLLARALVWAATEPRCGGEAFNITNGDFSRWEYLWPAIAAFFGLEAGGIQTLRLTTYMSDKAAVWRRIVAKYALRDYAFEQIAAWGFFDAFMNIDYDVMSDTLKARRFGFSDAVDTTAMWLRLLAQFRADRIIP